MANTPDDPRRPHPDDHPKPKPSPVPEDPESDSAIDLGQLGEGEVSGISVIEWASLVEAPRPTAESNLRLDAPSDIDLLAELSQKPQPLPEPIAQAVPGEEELVDWMAEAEAEAEFIGTDEPVKAEAASAEEDALFADLMAGSIDLSADPPSQAEPAPLHDDPEADVIFDLGAPSTEPAAVASESGSFVDLGADAILEEEIVDLGSGAIFEEVPHEGAIEPVAEDAIDLGGTLLIDESGSIDLGAKGQAEDEPIYAAAPSSSAIDLGRAAIILEEPASYAGTIELPESAILSATAADSGAPIDLAMDAIILEETEEAAASGVIDLGDDAIVIEEPSSHAGGIDLAETSRPHSKPGDSGAPIDLGMDALIIEESADDLDAIDLGMATVIAEQTGDSDAPIDLGMEALVGEDYAEILDEEAIDLGDDALVVEEALDPASAVSSGIDLAAPTVSVGPSSVNLLANDIILEQPVAGSPSSSNLSRDLIAEGLESGTDLAASRKSRAKSDEEGAIDDFLNETNRADDSSSVDLGSSPELRLFDDSRKKIHDPFATGADSDIRIEDIPDAPSEAGHDDYAEIDIDQIEETPSKPAGKKSRAAAIETDELEALAEEEISAEAAFDDEEPVAKKGTKKGKPVEEDEEDELPRKKKRASDDDDTPRPRGRTGAWLGGTFLGTLVGAGACVALWFSGLIPPEWLGQPAGQKPNTGADVTQPAPIAFERTLDQIRNGDLDQVKPDELAKADESKPDELVGRAEFHWLSYLRAERGKDPEAKLKPDAEPVKLALQDIDKAIKGSSAEAKANALFLRGQIHEAIGNRAAARGDYEEGAKQFAADPAQKARFDNALSVMELTGRAMALPPGPPRDMLVALIVMLQAPPGDKPADKPAAAIPDEAGYRFWQAVKLARDGKSAEAVKALDEARARHDQRRYLLPRKPQNPRSDPREEIFLRACDELKAYWAYQAKLKNDNYLEADEKDRIAEVDKLLTKVTETTRAEQLKTLGKLFKDKPIAKVEDLVDLVQAERKAAEADKLTLNTTVEEQKKKLDQLGDDIKVADKKIEATDKSLKETQAAAKKAQADRDAADAVLKQVGEVVGSEFTDVKTSRDSLLREVRETVRTAKTADPRGTIRQLEKELVVDRAKLAQRWNPNEMLAVWAATLQKNRGNKELTDRAMKDVRRVLDDLTSKDEAKAQAQLVQGLIERNAEQYTEAKATLTKARAGLLDSKGDWLTWADDALRDVADPAGDFARRAKVLEDTGKPAEAMAVLDRGVKNLPDHKGALLIQRAKTAFESARSKGALKLKDPLVQSAQKDAAAAAEEGLAEGHYLSGRIAEELGQFDEAIKSYRAAIKAHGKSDAEGSRYRISLARVLLKQKASPAGSSRLQAPRPEAIALERAALRRGVTIDVVSVLALMMLQVDALPGEKPASSAEAEKLADEILALGDKAPFDARAQALAIKGLHTRALTVYTTGLRDNGLLGAEYANTLLDLINAHPVLRRPESLTTADPLQATKYYGSGLNFFFARKYASAEREFLSAVENDKGDARYYYFLGLSRLAQGNRDAFEDFDQGARLEQQGKPDRGAVSTALERVQGRLRSTLNDIRSRPIRDSSK